MAKLEYNGFESLNDAFARISEIPFSVTKEALDAMAKVAADEIRSTGEYMGIRDEDSDVHVLDHIKTGKAVQTDDGGYEKITFSGTRRRGSKGTQTREAEIAFVNEFGKRGQGARPFVRTAMTKNGEQIAEPGEKIIGDWIENEFSKQ